ncbi:MAG: AAA family ATPase [Bacteroidales bacterium]|nr:AAA family ATPase [Bacteroidales bacterium]
MNTANYFAQLRNLVDSEHQTETQEFVQQIANLCPDGTGKIARPSCRYPVRLIDERRNAMNQFVLGVLFDADSDDIEPDFEPGKAVVFFYFNGAEAVVATVAVQVERADANGLAVIVAPSVMQQLQSLSARHLLGIHLAVDDTSYRVMRDALSVASQADRKSFVALRNVLIGAVAPTRSPQPTLSFSWLNAAQNAAIQMVAEAHEVAIVHGPPGTGKTTTLVEAIIETLRREPQVLVCAPSNAAVDWISEQLMRRGVAVLRLGNPLRVSDTMLECSYEQRYVAHPDYHELWNIRRRLHEQNDGETAQRLRHRQTELEIKIENDLYDQARVVSATLAGAAMRLPTGRRFATLFIDEAAQALEPLCWAALLRADRVVMGGDHQQLPPTVKSISAARQGLSTTLMQKVAQLWPNSVSLLDTQYRMHADIMQFSSQWFYGGLLKAHPSVADRLVSPIDTPLVWVDTSRLGLGERTGGHTSLSNMGEARLVIHTLRDYIESLTPTLIESQRTDFGIITPYRSQARLLRRLLKMQHFFRRLKGLITVGTVDGFQGRERDVIIISLVRDNDSHTIGFMRDLRRMNVAMTRARMKLIIVGNATTLASNRFYARLAQYVEKQGKFITLTPYEDSQKENPA